MGRSFRSLKLRTLWSRLYDVFFCVRGEHSWRSGDYLPFDEWTAVFGSERLTGALLDHLTHHVNILEMNGDSYRLNQSRRRQTPTAN